MKQENMKEIYVTISGWTDGSGWDYTNAPIDPMPMYKSSTSQEITSYAEEYVKDFAANEEYKEGHDVKFRFFSNPEDELPICEFWLNEYINIG